MSQFQIIILPFKNVHLWINYSIHTYIICYYINLYVRALVWVSFYKAKLKFKFTSDRYEYRENTDEASE